MKCNIPTRMSMSALLVHIVRIGGAQRCNDLIEEFRRRDWQDAPLQMADMKCSGRYVGRIYRARDKQRVEFVALARATGSDGDGNLEEQR